MSARQIFIGRRALAVAALGICLPAMLSAPPSLAQTDPLRSWNDGKAKQAITGFVQRVTRDGSADYVPPAERVGREYAYDRQSPVGRPDKAWDEAVSRGWVVIDMTADWRTVFPPQQR